MNIEQFLPWVMVVVGIVGLGQGASWLVDGASRLALRLGVSPMVVGLVVVGFGTSMPEFAVSVRAAVVGSGGLSLGNAVGSNIMNLLLVLGVAAMLKPIHVVGGARVLRRDLIFGVVPALRHHGNGMERFHQPSDGSDPAGRLYRLRRHRTPSGADREHRHDGGRGEPTSTPAAHRQSASSCWWSGPR